MSTRKSISNTFTVTTLVDGESAPYYFEEKYAWSNDSSTQSVTTPPSISGGWQTSIPPSNGYAYLWRMSIRHVWNESTRSYTQEAAQYFRMSGTNGTSIHIKGHVSTVQNLPTTHVDGDAYVVDANGHLYMWSDESGSWVDIGVFQGEAGKTYYTHIAWASQVNYSGTTVTSVDGFITDKSPNDTTHMWMGVYIDEQSGQDESNALRYTWSYTKGDTGGRGKTGRFYYYGGEFDNTDTTKTFKINDAETPYFSHGTNAVTGLPNCHVYNPSTNPSSDLTMAQMWANSNQSWNNAPWQTFTNDFQYLMTRAVFSDQAYLGSFVVNTDWLISQHGKVNHVASTAYTKFYPEFVNGGDLCENFDVNVNYILAGSAYFVGGKKYYIKVSGSSFSSGCQLNVRMYNGSSNVGNTINLTSSSPNGTITFEPTTSGTYYLRADCQPSGMTAKLTAYVDCFVPNFAVDGLTGKTYQNDAFIKGNIYRPALTINNNNYSTYAPKNQNDVYVIDLKKTGLNILLDFNLSTGTLLIDLPYGDEYIGAEVTIINNSNKCAFIKTILWGKGDASFPIYGKSGYAHFKYVKVTSTLGNTVGKWRVLGSIYDPGNYVNE